MQVRDKISFEILEDGTITCNTDAISKENHLEADELVNTTFEELGGKREVLYRKPHSHDGHGHTHVHGTVHA